MKQLITNPYSFDSYTVEKDRHGRATVKAKIMKTGRLKYKMPDGSTYYGKITLDGLKKAAKTASLKPVIIKHPPKLVTSSDVMNYQEGISADDFTIEKIDGEDWLTGSLVLQSDRAIETAESGELGVSPGYFRFEDDIKKFDESGDLEFTPDINHIAIGCSTPRAEGASLSLDDGAIISLDEAEEDSARIYSFAKSAKPKKQEVIMKQKLNAVKVGDFSMDEAPIEYDEAGTGTEQAIAKYDEREEKLVVQLSKVQVSMDNAEETHKKEAGELSGENKALKTKVEDLEKEMENMISLDEVDEKAEERSDIKTEVESRGLDVSFKTILEGKRLVVEYDFPNQSFDDAEIEGAYKTRNVDKKDVDEQRKSKKALQNVKNISMDEKTVGISKINPSELKKKILKTA